MSSPTVQILNPLSGGKVSDKYDGIDRRFHITAIAAGVPSEAVVEAVIRRGSSADEVLGTLCPVQGTRDTFEGFWDIPEAFPEGQAELLVNVFDRAGAGAQVLASDFVPIDVQHRAEGSSPSSEAIEFLWPPNDGPLGFFRNNAGVWATSIQAIGGSGATGLSVRYSTTPIGGEPRFTGCAAGATTTTTTRQSDSARLMSFTCRLNPGDRPSAITAMAVVVQSGADSSDVHRVNPFIQQSSEMKVSLDSVYPATLPPLTTSADYPSGRRRLASQGCLQFAAVVKDQFGRTVIGANVDVQIKGPGEGASFGDPVDASTSPDKKQSTESGVTCSGAPSASTRQSREIVADGPDTKAVESTNGTNELGKWGFRIFSADPGMTKISAWVDDERLDSDIDDRPTDNDQHDPGEGLGTVEGQWLEAPIGIGLAPADESAPTGSCRIYLVTVLSGQAPLANFNVDFHARVPDSELTLCGPGIEGVTPPDSGHDESHSHPVDPPGTFGAASQCAGEGPVCRHFEATTDERGEITFGLSSLIAGEATIRAWADGEPGQDTDQPSSKAAATAVTHWVIGKTDATAKLLSPSTDQATGAVLGRISTDTYRVSARVGAPYLVEEVFVYLSHTTLGEFLIGQAQRVGDSNVYEFVWNLNRPLEESESQPGGSPSATPVPTPSGGSPSPSPIISSAKTGVPDGVYTITARIEGSISSDSHSIEVNRSLDVSARDTSGPYDYVKLTRPFNGGVLSFLSGATTISGVASAGAEGVDLFYSIASASERPIWKSCGYRKLDEFVQADKQFQGLCRLQGVDRPDKVSAVAAVAFNCNVTSPDCAEPSPTPLAPGVPTVPRSNRGARGAGEAVGVSGCDGSPCMVLTPSDWQAATGECVSLSAQVAEANTPSEGAAVAVEFSGPTDRIRFCDPLALGRDDSWPFEEAVEVDQYGPDVHRILGQTDKQGLFRFGVFSADSTFADIYSVRETAKSSVFAWVDDGDLAFEAGEAGSSAELHWELPGRCTIVGRDDLGDVISGTPGPDKICGRGGDDIIYADKGRDLILGGDGDDEIFGDAGADSIFGESGNDLLTGGPGADKLDGGDGTDRCDRGSAKGDAALNCEEEKRSPDAKSRRSSGRYYPY